MRPHASSPCDRKGRHTTSARSLHPIPGAAVLIDTPGMRELVLGSGEGGVGKAFRDIARLARHCRFADCAHGDEPGCAVRAAVVSGEIDPRRLESWRKLAREETVNAESLAESRERSRKLGKLYRSVQRHARVRKGQKNPGPE